MHHQSNHHTLSLYIADGYDTWHKTPHGWRNGGGPDRFCLMPAGSGSVRDIRARLSFVHLYCTPEHLSALAEKIWDRSPSDVIPDEKIFANDGQITQLYRQFLLNYDWQQPANHLLLSTASTLLLTCLVQQYSRVNRALPSVSGGLAPATLAGEAALSEYHFSRMFRQSTGLPPHQYVMEKRMAKAAELLRYQGIPLTDIAVCCGFNSLSHFSHRFRRWSGMSPSAYRQSGCR